MPANQGLTAEQYQAVVAIVDARLKDILVTRADFDRLGQAQERVEVRLDRVEAALERLAEAQARTEERLAEAQARTEERLAEAQARTEERFAELAEHITILADGLHTLRQQVGRLSSLVGASAEAEAERLLLDLLPQKGYRLLDGPAPVALDGEVDVAVAVADAQGNELWVLLEARTRLRRRDVQDWNRRLNDRQFLVRLGREGINPPFLPYVFGLRVYRDAQEEARATGMGVMSPRGQLVEPSLRP